MSALSRNHYNIILDYSILHMYVVIMIYKAVITRMTSNHYDIRTLHAVVHVILGFFFREKVSCNDDKMLV